MNLDKIILGHNQFFGTNHMSSERGAEKANYFSDINNVNKIVKIATVMLIEKYRSSVG